MISPVIIKDLSLTTDENGYLRSFSYDSKGVARYMWYWAPSSGLPFGMLEEYLYQGFELRYFKTSTAPEFIYLCRNGV